MIFYQHLHGIIRGRKRNGIGYVVAMIDHHFPKNRACEFPSKWLNLRRDLRVSCPRLC